MTLNNANKFRLHHARETTHPIVQVFGYTGQGQSKAIKPSLKSSSVNYIYGGIVLTTII